jgi:hypothetical protein
MAIVSDGLLPLKLRLKPELLRLRCFSSLVKVSGLLQSILKPRLFTSERRNLNVNSVIPKLTSSR